MAKLTNIHFVKLVDGEKIVFNTTVNVTKEGLFTTTLPKEATDLLESYGPKLDLNRVGRAGFFSSDTLEGLRREIEKTIEEAVSKELIEDKLIIKYSITTAGHYALDTDGEIIPNGCWRKDPEERKKEFGTNWREGNSKGSTMYGTCPSVSVFARVFHKKTYAYRSGRTIQQLETYYPETKDGRGKAIDWINSLCNISSTRQWNGKEDFSNTPEIDATEENAEMLVQLFKLVFQCNELFKEMNNPEYMLAFIANKRQIQIENK